MKIDKKVVLNDLSNLLRNRFADNLKDVVLFVSQVNGTAHKVSDYDFLIVLKEKVDWKTEHEISDLCFEIDLKYEILSDTHIIVKRSFQPYGVNNPFLQTHWQMDCTHDSR